MKCNIKISGKIVGVTLTVVVFSFYLLPLAYLQADEVTILTQALNHEDLIVRLSAIKTLGEIRDARTVEPLIAILKDESCGCTAANALVKIGKPAVEPLIAALKDEDLIVRRNAATALGQIKDASAAEPLIASIKDKSSIVRRDAAIALGQIKDVRAVEPLMAALKDEDAIVRMNAATALGEIDIFCLLPIGCHPEDHVIVLIRKLNHEDLIIRLSAIKALGEIRDAIAVDPLVATLGDKDCGCTAANALARIGKPSVESLCAALKDDSAIARRNAATALGKIKDASAVEPLIATLKDEDLIVRRNAATALGQIQDARAVESLISALKDKNPIVRRNVATALGQIQDARAVESLISALKDKDAIVRANAVTALGGIGKPAVEALIVNIID